MTSPTEDQEEEAGSSTSSGPATEGDDGSRREPDAQGTPARIGRFAVLRRIGAGGMGVVYSAYDENLDRRVAIKLLHADALPGSRGETRLQREAQAMARLSHPNVVQVYEVGEHDGRVFIAMEFVKGRTVRAWLSETPRSWPEILDVYLQAGEGLVAAHLAGLVHRDFKPANVLVAFDEGGREGVGRVRVLDFGLARPQRAPGSATDDTLMPQLERSGSVLAEEVTQAGALMGTPAYMSPEQYQQEPGDAQSDQFSFCVSLYEALYGRRPFEGSNRLALGMAILRGEVAGPPPGSTVPAWLHRVVLRGLTKDPADRWPDMRALLQALVPRQRRSVSFWVAAVGTGAFFVSAAGYLIGRGAEASPCTQGPERLAAAWSDARRAELTDAIGSARSGLAEETARRLGPAIDRYGERWIAMYVDACEATEVRREQSQSMLDRRVACLDERLRQLGATVDVLMQADAEVVEHALDAIARLPPIEPCGDRAALLSGIDPPSDPALVATVEELRDVLAEVRALRDAGKIPQAREMAEGMRERVEATGYIPLQAETQYAIGQIAIDLGEHDRAIELLREAHWTALQARDDMTAFHAASLLSHVVGDLNEEYEAGLQWWRSADALLRRMGGEDGMDRAWLLSHRGNILYKRGDYEGARQDLDEAVALAEAQDSVQPGALASFVNNRANVDLARDALESAEAMYRRALALREEVSGPDHPSHVSSLANLSGVLNRTGRDEEAVAVLRRAEQILELSGNADSVRGAHVSANLGVMLRNLGREDEARAANERALAIYREKLGPDHPNVGMLLINHAADHYDDGHVEEGRAMMQQALDIFERSVGPDHPNAAHARIGVADGFLQAGKPEQALALYQQSLATWETIYGKDHATLAAPLLGIGRAHIDLDRPDRAIPELERALDLASNSDPSDPQLADIRFALAQALWSARRDRPRARQLAEQAQATYAANPDLTSYATEVTTWLDTHPQ